MNVLLMIQGSHIYRIKGIMNFWQHDQRTIVQSVRANCVFQQGGVWHDDQEKGLSNCLYW